MGAGLVLAFRFDVKLVSFLCSSTIKVVSLSLFNFYPSTLTALVRWFVRSITAVGVSIAEEGAVDTLSIVARKFKVCTACWHSNICIRCILKCITDNCNSICHRCRLTNGLISSLRLSPRARKTSLKRCRNLLRLLKCNNKIWKAEAFHSAKGLLLQ